MLAIAIALPLVAAACFGVAGPHLAERLPPREATWLISVGAVASALSAVAVLCLLAAVLLGQLPDIAGLGHWSTSALRRHAPAEPGFAAASLLAALLAASTVAYVAIRRARAVIFAYRACRSMSGSGDLVVVDGAPPSAVAVPGRPGRVVVSASLMRVLSPGERRAVLAHERAHLAHGHHWHRSAVSMAVAAIPLLAPLRGAIAYATERWADEDAAAEVGNRRHAAAALARVALLISSSTEGRTRLALAQHAVPARVSALLEESPRRRPIWSLAVIALLASGLLAAVFVEKQTEHVFELAGHAFRMSRG
jgi:Zn-dependent protease with chaperone function